MEVEGIPDRAKPKIHTDETVLLRNLRQGDEVAFARLVEEYRAMVLNLVTRMTGRVDSAEDLAQEVFLRVWKALPRFRGECKLSTWIYRITINLCIAEGKSARGRATHIPLDDPGLLSFPQVRVQADNEYAEEVVLKDRLGPLILQMPDHYRTAISLYYLKDLTYQEIADIMSVPMGTVKSYLYRGKAWLRDRLLGKQLAGED